MLLVPAPSVQDVSSDPPRNRRLFMPTPSLSLRGARYAGAGGAVKSRKRCREVGPAVHIDHRHKERGILDLRGWSVSRVHATGASPNTQLVPEPVRLRPLRPRTPACKTHAYPKVRPAACSSLAYPLGSRRSSPIRGPGASRGHSVLHDPCTS